MPQLSDISISHSSIIESVKDAIIAIDLTGKIFYVNNSAEKLFKYQHGELLGQDIGIIFPPGLLHERKKLVEDVLWGEQVDFYETERIDKNKNTLYVSVSLSPLTDEQGKLTGITKVIRDITDKKRSESKFQALLESAPDAMVIVNKFGQIVLVNAQTEKLFGYDRANLVGLEVEKLIPARFNHHHSEHRKNFFENPKVREMGAGLELFGTRKDGSEFPVEISLSPLKIEEGLYVSAAIRDISARKKSEAKFRGLLESAPDAMVIVDERGLIQLVNAQTEKLFEYNREEIIGQKVEILIPERYNAVHAPHRENFFSEPRTRAMGVGLELYGKKKNGSEFPVEISLSPIETEEGLLVSAAIRDITDQKKAASELTEYAERLENSNKELEQFAYVASHDLQEPLRKIQVFSGRIIDLEYGNLSKKAQKYFSFVQNAASRMQTLIEDLLAFSRLQTSENRFECSDIHSIIEDEISIFKETIREKNATVEIEGNCNVSIIPFQFRQLIHNLASNALKFSKTDEPPKIQISSKIEKGQDSGHAELKPKTDYCRITVKDNGIGFDEKYSNKLFNLFQRLHSTDEYPGTGIGLAIVKKVVDNHHGFITVKSELNKGSTFDIYLPHNHN